MPFSEAIRLVVRSNAFFRCCVCHEIGIEVHHIIPESEGGPDTLDNAAPLCPNCHSRYGANPVKRKLIKEIRDDWYVRCAGQPGLDPQLVERVESRLSGIEAQLNEIRALVARRPMGSISTDLSVGGQIARLFRRVVSYSGQPGETDERNG